MIEKSTMKVYRYSSKIKKSETADGKFIDCKSGLRLEQMKKLSVGIYVLIIASLLQCIGGTGTYILWHEK